jgi:integrase
MAIQKFQTCSCRCGWTGPRRIFDAQSGAPAHPADCPKCGAVPDLGPETSVRWRTFYYKDGRQISRTRTTKAAAVKLAREVGTAADRGEEIDPKRERMTFAEIAAEYLELGAAGENGFAKSTQALYGMHLRRYLLPALGSRRIASIRKVETLKLLADMRARGVGEPTVRGVHKLLHAIGEHAVETECRGANFAALNKDERRKLRPRNKEVTPPTQEQVAAIAAEVPPRYRALVWTLALAGLRVGEATALRVRDLDLREGIIHVRVNAPEVNGTKYLDEPTKTDRSVRDVEIAPELATMLAEHLNRFSNRFDPTALVFTNKQGAAVRQSNFRKNVFQPAAKRAKVEPIPTVHSLRHAFASVAAEHGFTLLEVADMLGHAATSMTQIYSHTFKERRREKVARLGALIREEAQAT